MLSFKSKSALLMIGVFAIGTTVLYLSAKSNAVQDKDTARDEFVVFR